MVSKTEFASKKASIKMVNQQLLILLAEDDEGHASLVQRNLKRAGIANEVVHVKDGQEALAFIHCQGGFAKRIPNSPLLLLLDINMPRLDGDELLLQLQSD